MVSYFYRLKPRNFTKIGLCHGCSSENLQKIFRIAFLQSIYEQLLRKRRSLFHFPRNCFILTFDLIWWNKISRLNKYHDKNIAAHVCIQSNQKRLKIYMLDSFVYKLGVSIRYYVTSRQVISGNLLTFSSHSSVTKVHGSGKHSPVVRVSFFM